MVKNFNSIKVVCNTIEVRICQVLNQQSCPAVHLVYTGFLKTIAFLALFHVLMVI